MAEIKKKNSIVKLVTKAIKDKTLKEKLAATSKREQVIAIANDYGYRCNMEQFLQAIADFERQHNIEPKDLISEYGKIYVKRFIDVFGQFMHLQFGYWGVKDIQDPLEN
ncbi:MAG: Nif11-like leader peptide family natural product precursor [Prochloraceae cyanobacterium]|nr:Nif11-like leader peptide family natural product precursor [Prochloraceae cyanobacterium]